MRTDAILSSAYAPFPSARRTHHGSEPDREIETALPHENTATGPMRQTSKQAITPRHPLPVRRAGWRGGGTGNGGGPLIDEASGTQDTASPHPPASDEQTDEEDGGTDGNSERAGARERHGKKANRQTAAMPTAANQIASPHIPRPGAGERIKQAN